MKVLAPISSYDELEMLASFAADHDLLIFCDETYEQLVWPGYVHVSIGSLAGARDRTVTVTSMGKTYSVTGIYERDRRLLEFLESRGVRPGIKVRLLERNYDQTISVRTAKGAVILGRLSAERVWVAPAA